jgi:DNA-binding FadR family transcriptional regulator
LAETLGVSRTVIREAMRSLLAQGLVEVSQGRRPRVKPADPQDAIESLNTLFERSDGAVLDLMEVRRPVESEIAGLAATRATQDQMERLAEAIADELSADSLDRRVAADMRIHEILAEATGTLWGLLRSSLTRTIKKTGARRAVEGHQLVLEAVRRHDARAAREAMLLHLSMAEQDLRV